MDNISHILVVDDDDRIRNLLGKFLADSGFFISTSKDASNARDKIKQFIYDLIVVDVMMPGETGIEFTKYVRQNSKVPILMLTAMGEVEDRITGLESGADDYLPKPFDPRELLLRIKNILNRSKSDDTFTIVNFGEVSFDIVKKSLTKNGDNLVISSNEVQLLTHLLENKANPISREDLAGLCGGINERSVDVQITRLRNKIEKNPKNPSYIKTVRGQGYVLYSD